MRRTQRGRANAFLIEMILVLLLFALSSTVTLLLFTRAHERSERSVALNESMLILQSAADAIRAGNDAAAAFLSIYPNARDTGGALMAQVDALGEPNERGNYTLELTVRYENGSAGRMERARLRALEGGSCRFELTVENYVPEGAAA